MLTVEELAENLKVHKITVLRHIRNGKIKAIRMGKFWRVNEEEVERIKREGF